MYIENGYIVEDNQEHLIVLLEIKRFTHDIGSNFYEVKINKEQLYDADIPVTTKIITNPIEYMQEVSKSSPLTLNSLISYDRLEDYYKYLVQLGIIRETKESIRQDFKYRGFYSLKSSKYNTQDEPIYERKTR